MRRRVWVTAGALVAVAGVALGLSAARGEPATKKSAGPTPAATTPILRTDLVVRESLEGTLGYGDQRAVGTHTAGTVTASARTGSLVRRGDRLFAVDGVPVVLLYGRTPAYRTMTVGTEGADVRQLERNLEAMGYADDIDVDDTYTSGTAAAVEDWQEDLGVAETGDVALGSVVFRSGPVRIAKRDVDVGTPVTPGQTVVTTSALVRTVRVDFPVAKLRMVQDSESVQVELPDGRTLEGKVSSVGTVVTTGGGEQGEEQATVAVTVTLTGRRLPDTLDSTPVEVAFQSERRASVLGVPVNALVALPEGGYAVVVVQDGSRRTVPVKLGVFADGLVEVSGDGLGEGMEVEVPSV